MRQPFRQSASPILSISPGKCSISFQNCLTIRKSRGPKLISEFLARRVYFFYNFGVRNLSSDCSDDLSEPLKSNIGLFGPPPGQTAATRIAKIANGGFPRSSVDFFGSETAARMSGFDVDQSKQSEPFYFFDFCRALFRVKKLAGTRTAIRGIAKIDSGSQKLQNPSRANRVTP